MIALELGLVIFVAVFVPIALAIFNIRQRNADQEMRLVRLEHKVHAIFAHLGIPDDPQHDPVQEVLRRGQKQ